MASVGIIVVSQTKVREHIQGIIDQRETNAKDRDKEKARAAKAEKTLAATANELQRTTAAWVSTSNDLVTARANLADTTSARDKAVQDLEKAREAEKAVRLELAQWAVLEMKPEQIKAMREDLAKIKEAVTVLDEEKKILNRHVAKLKSQLALLTDPTYEVELPNGLKGSIKVVDPRWEFVILDIGEKQGVLENGVMMAHRNSKFIGKVKIASVMSDTSIANVMPGWRLQEFQEGDQVLYLQP
ncbi:MAG: hypothetical protein NTW03_22440 [Verrucomicrobia bacterium]|nr:hypothetical protein [Verrucomicrobiota bacterium]